MKIFAVGVLCCFLLACHSQETNAPEIRAGAKVEASSQSQPEVSAPAADPLEGTVRIRAGTFQFGATETQLAFYLKQSTFRFPGMEEKFRQLFITPPRPVQLPEYSIDQFEATNEQYGNFVRATRYRPPNSPDYLKHWSGLTSYPDWAATFPVVWISQQDAQAYCKWRGGRLPTEEEWEKAARGVDGRYFPWGNVFPTADTANFNTNKPEPAGNRPGDKSPHEAYDMGGNVSEITSSRLNQGGQVRIVLRGGSFRGMAREMLTYQRAPAPSDTRSDALGCRCVVPQRVSATTQSK